MVFRKNFLRKIQYEAEEKPSQNQYPHNVQILMQSWRMIIEHALYLLLIFNVIMINIQSQND